MFPRYNDWDIAYTRNAFGKQNVKQILAYIVAIIVALAIGAVLVWRE